jgi:ribosomal protein L14
LQTRWDDLTRRGRAILHERFSLESVGDQVVDFVERLTTDKKTLREKDVIQAILWREQHRSTQFFGKYIEQKGAARQA